ncbi:GAF domain-containing protein [Hymenobacter sp.]|uniref:GAF domain-containing protein n=1 Tax=Hymenobacter sp. TaxID=1898978 RepID=UPI00286BADC0|nr:GAF domain-containing protein [Hymenobacter sp.]
MDPIHSLANLLASPGLPPEARLQRTLEAVGHHLDVDRCFLYVRNPARGRGRIALVWRRDDAVPDPRHPWQDDTGTLPHQDPLFRAALAARPSVYVEDVETAGPEILNREFEHQTFGHRALVHAHIVADQTLWGILQPCVFGRPRPWTAAERAYLGALLPPLQPVVEAYMAGQSVD